MMLRSSKNAKLESGLRHWLYQKITAILLIPITIWFLLKLPRFFKLNFDEKIYWINNSPNYYLLTFFFIISALHFKLGLTVVIEDYIHNSVVKKLLLTIISIIALFIMFSSLILCSYKILGM